MPSHSKKQARFMAAAAHNSKFAKKVGISQKVAKEFNKADKGKHFKEFSENMGKLVETMTKESELDAHSRWVLDSGMNTLMDADDPFASWQGMDLQRKHYDKKSMDIIDKALELTANAKDAHERLDILKKYAEEAGVDFSDLYYQITQDTGAGYFADDDYMKGHQFQRPTRESMHEAFAKIKPGSRIQTLDIIDHPYEKGKIVWWDKDNNLYHVNLDNGEKLIAKDNQLQLIHEISNIIDSYKSAIKKL